MPAATSERVLFVHAHPDDESITTGGTIAALVASGAHVSVVTCTRGERPQELSDALEILGVREHRFLGATGARWPGNPERRYTESYTLSSGGRAGDSADAIAIAGDVADESLANAPFGEVASDIATVISEVAPHAVVGYNEWGGHGHPDHIRVHQAARRAAEVMGVAFFAIEPEDSAATPTMSVDVTPHLDRKRQAIEAYASRLTVSGNTVTRATGETAPIGATESFRRIRSVPAPSDAFRDLGLATQIAAIVLVAAVGALGGLLLTAIHQSTIQLGEVSFPLGVVAAMLATIALMVGLRVLFDTRVLPAIAGALLLTATAILALPTPGGSVVVPANAAGYVWTFGPALVTLLVLAWPRLNRPTIRRPAATESETRGSE